MNNKLKEIDPEFMKIMDHFINNEVRSKQIVLSKKENDLIAVVSIVVQGSSELLKEHLIFTINDNITAIEIKEAIYQCAPYIGFPKVVEALKVANEIFISKDIKLPLKEQATVDENTRFNLGVDVQATIFGQKMRDIANLGNKMPRESYYLASNCFGDYYTRTGLALKTREMLTLAILINLGVEPQIKAHIFGNQSIGNSKEYIMEVAFGCLPYCGYPKLLNSLNYITEEFEK